MILRLLVFIFMTLLNASLVMAQNTAFLENLLRNDTSKVMKKVMKDPQKYKMQIIYTQITRTKSGQPLFNQYSYNLNTKYYYYPASLVKLPVCLMALEKMKQLNIDGLDRNKIMVNYTANQPGCEERLSTLADNIEKMLVVSDNAAFNVVYDFLGHEYINQRLEELGYIKSRINQKLATGDSIFHKTSMPVQFRDPTGMILYHQGQRTSEIPIWNPAENTKVGKGVKEGKKVIKEPKDFKASNYLALDDIHKMLMSVIFPEQFKPEERFDLSENDRSFVLRCISMFPREANRPEWSDQKEYYDGSRKYLLFGTSSMPVDSNIRSYNKVGLAYGFMSDVAYIQDKDQNIEFFLSAVIYVNEDEILNDGTYEYTGIGYPFMARLGRMIYDYEISRKKKIGQVMKK